MSRCSTASSRLTANRVDAVYQVNRLALSQAEASIIAAGWVWARASAIIASRL
jgi:hypothetical protein